MTAFNLTLTLTLTLSLTTILIVGPPKSFDRALDKFRQKGDLRDLNRCTLEVEDPYVMAIIYHAMTKMFVVCGVKVSYHTDTKI